MEMEHIHVIDDEEYIKNTLIEAAKIAKLEVLKVDTHKFQPYGVTGYALLSESHISIHTWPERNFASIDIFMCGNCDPQTAVDYLQKILDPSSVDLSLNRRGVISAVAQIYS